MRIKIEYQDGTSKVFPATWGWNYLCGSFGVWLFQELGDTFSAVFLNGAVGNSTNIGGFFFARVWVLLDTPQRPWIHERIGHVAQWGDSPEAVGFGTGADYFPPRAIHVIRWALSEEAKDRIYNRAFRRGTSPFVSAPNALAFLKPKYDGYADELLHCLRTGVGNQNRDVWTSCLGFWHPIGITRGDRPGGEGIDATPGWHRSSKFDLVCMDMRLDRSPVAWVSANTGEPIIMQRPEYTGYRTWNKSGVFDEFVVPRTNGQWEDNRIPRDVNQGTASYRGMLVPVEYTNANGEKEWTYPFEPDDVAHLCRLTAHLKSCRDLWHDKAAELCLRMVAADAWAAWKPRAVVRGTGLPGPLRGTGWTLDALVAARYIPQASLIVRNLNLAQMINGLWQNWSFKESAGLGSPNPWNYGMDHEYNAAQVKENAYTAGAMAQFGAFGEASACMYGIYGEHHDPDIWQAVAQSQTVFPRSLNASAVGKDHHQHWGALGILARKNKSWLRVASRLVPPDGVGPLGQDIVAGLVAHGYYEGTSALIEAAE